jgi:ABC-type antimicrobial peptide transport system permease subunit
MLRNYFKLALRNLQRNKVHGSINIIGLALGMAIALVIGLWIKDELSFDHYHTNHRRLAEVLLLQTNKEHAYAGPTCATPLGKALSSGYRDAFEHVAMVSWSFPVITAYGDKHFSDTMMYAQAEFPGMFTYHMIRGRVDALKDPSTILIAHSLATALFGNNDPIGKSVKLDNFLDLQVGGVYEDLPLNTTFACTKALLPWENKTNGLKDVTDWDDHGMRIFVQLRDKISLAQTNARIRDIPKPFIKQWLEQCMLQPLDKLHFASEIIDGKAQGGGIQIVWLMGVIGAFVLLLACINFMNLSTARSERRAKEVGIRKTIGTLRSQLIGQFLVESILTAFMAGLIALLLVQLTLPFFDNLAGKAMGVPYLEPVFWACFLGFTLLTGLLAGSYPAFYLSAFKPIKVLKGLSRAGRGAILPREILVVLQFTVSLTLIIGTVIVFRQIQTARDRPMGFQQTGLVTVGINTEELFKNYDALRNDLLQTGLFDNIAQSSQSTINFNNNNSLIWPGMDSSQLSIFFRNVTVTPEFGPTIRWNIAQGRNFSRAFPTDSDAMIINETAAKIMGKPHPLGLMVKFWDRPFRIIGVVKDMFTNDPYRAVEPALFIERGGTGTITLRIKDGAPLQSAMTSMAAAFKRYNPSSPFMYQFNDTQFALKFESEERLGKLAGIFAGLAIFISCLGLFALASFMAEQRTKEIGIRKVLGAGMLNLWSLLSRDFIKLSTISLFLAIPLAYYGMHTWLQNYDVRTTLPWWIFAGAGLGMVLLTLATVSFQSLSAARRNPVRSLRME